MKKYHLLLLTIALTFCGVGMFLYKALCLDYPVVPNTTESRWVVEAHLSFNAKNKAVKAALKIPKSTENFLLMDENFISRGYGLATRTIGDDREATWTRRSAIGRQGLYYRAVIKDGGIDGRVDIPKSRDQTPEGALKEAMNSIIADAKQKSADTETFVTSLIGLFQTKNSNVKMLLGSRPDRAKKAKVAVAILNESGLRARVVHGIFLNVDRNVPITQRVQVLDNKTWLMFDPETGERTGQDLFLPWWYGDADIATVTNASQIRTTISVERFQEEALTAASEYARKVAPKLVDFSLFSLPVETQRVYRVLLLVPIGAFLVVLLRNIVGFVTFGTFMPVLIGLSFRETGLSWGIVLFSLLIGLGVIARFYLESLKLLLVPRLSAVLIIVVLIMAVLSVITHQLGLERGVSVALFPMVIITMTIERMSIVWDELGVFAAFKQGIGTLLVACIIYLIIRSHYLEHLIFVFPELLLVVLAMTLLMGRYSGYRLLELRRFHALTKEPVKND
ncbi:MAG: inactive transglutaminase family protein [Bdellovibrionota bacterium]